MSFGVGLLAPALIGPVGNLAAPAVTFSWSAVTNATWYQLWVTDTTGVRYQKWFTSTETNCASSSTCSISIITPLTPGQVHFWVQAWRPGVLGPWSAGLAFTLAALPAPTMITPNGQINTATVNFTWSHLPGAAQYYLWVNDVSGNRIKRWYLASSLGCDTGTCRVTVTHGFGSGAGSSWVQGWSPIVGYGPWSAPLAFVVP